MKRKIDAKEQRLLDEASGNRPGCRTRIRTAFILILAAWAVAMTVLCIVMWHHPIRVENRELHAKTNRQMVRIFQQNSEISSLKKRINDLECQLTQLNNELESLGLPPDINDGAVKYFEDNNIKGGH